MATAPTCGEWWGLTNKITITMLPMIMKTIISLLIWPSTPLMTSGGRVGEEKSVLNLGLDIFGFRIFYDMRLLSPALASAGEMWVGHGVTCQMPTNITFTDNFCFLSKVFRNTSQTQDWGHWPGYQEYKPQYITIRGLPQQTLTPPLHIFQSIVRYLINYPLDTDAILCY